VPSGVLATTLILHNCVAFCDKSCLVSGGEMGCKVGRGTRWGEEIGGGGSGIWGRVWRWGQVLRFILMTVLVRPKDQQAGRLCSIRMPIPPPPPPPNIGS